MSENQDLVPIADVEEQQALSHEDEEGSPADVAVPLEANPADAAEQAAAVPFDEDEEWAPRDEV